MRQSSESTVLQNVQKCIYFFFIFFGGGGQDFDRMLEKVLKCLKNKSKSIRVTISIGMRFHGFDKV